jgi:DNA-binding winged helix-turn-helix (wHTH) protein
MSQVRTPVSYRFDDFHLDAANRQLSRNGEPIPLSSKYFDVLLLLVSRRGQLVEKHRIFEEVWDGVFVTDAALTQCIKDIRKQLGDDASSPRYIKTVPKHGYVFIGNAVDAGENGAMGSYEAVGRSQADDTSSLPLATRPYKFLDYYTERDAPLFFGREQEVEAICSQILARRAFILHGRSGVGKSSILRAGLMPRLKSQGHLVFVIRSFTDPVHQMVNALSEALGFEESKPDTDQLSQLLQLIRRVDHSRYVIFFLDQFEEFFLLLPEEARSRFMVAARELTAGDLPVRLVFALREDLLAEMSQLKSAIPEIFHHEYRLNRLNRAQAELAITGPARAVGCGYQPELITKLLADISDVGGVDPPQLQIVCDNLYDSRDENGSITLEAYERSGGAPQILAGYLERVLRRFNADDLMSAKRILTALISADGQRLVLKAAELEARIGTRCGGDPGTHLLIEELVAARILRRRRQDGAAWIELAHDFLTPEVSRWLSADEVALKRARGVVERAMENHQAHGLLIDADAVDLVMPFGEQLGLTGEEADLLLTSALNRGRSAQGWLVEASPRSSALIADASENVESDVRLRAIEAAASLRSVEMRGLLRKLALWDKDLLVRKSASIALGEWIGTAVEDALSDGHQGPHAGLIRQAISLAMVRDHNKRLVRLSHLSIPVSLLVVAGLMWVRLRRDIAEIVRRGIGGMLGGAVSGVAGGVILGTGLGIVRESMPLEAANLVLVLAVLGFFIGAIGGLGVSFGMISAVHVAYRHSKWWSVVGAAAGGAVVGGSTKLLGVDTVRALFGQSPTGITGALEGAVIGATLSLGVVLAATLIRRSRPWHRVLAASLGAMCAGVLLTVIGGNLFSASLEIVAKLFANSQIRMDPLAPLFGEVHFGQTTQIVMGAIEGMLFGAGVAGGIEVSSRNGRSAPEP